MNAFWSYGKSGLEIVKRNKNKTEENFILFFIVLQHLAVTTGRLYSTSEGKKYDSQVTSDETFLLLSSFCFRNEGKTFGEINLEMIVFVEGSGLGYWTMRRGTKSHNWQE